MADYLKFGGIQMQVKEIEEIMFSGNIEASKCLGNYYAKKRRKNNNYYPLCIDCYLVGANAGCPECMIMVSKYSYEYTRLIDDADKNLKVHYVSITVQYAYNALITADTRPLRKKALNCILRATHLIKKNIDIMDKHLYD